MGDFETQLDRAYKKKVVDRLKKTVRAVAFVVHDDLIKNTPVDTGRARANWLPTLNVQANHSSTSLTPESIEPITTAFKISDRILITNNLPYIRRLNDGWSKQAPAGFIDSALARGKQSVK